MTLEILTIGYERAGFDGLLEALIEAGVETVIDVRELPNSRRAGFSKSLLKANLAQAGIGYVHMKALGTPKAGRSAHRAGDMGTFWSIVDAALDRPEAHLALEQAAVLARGQRTCLMCLEHDWRICHRARVCERLAAAHGFTAAHLAPG
ncbi:MAG: DUF488 domain-containing protein [Hyphomonadaceae bacterium]|nr:DUF488 domain-containing protein [Hyphomonadaceae bacterium]